MLRPHPAVPEEEAFVLSNMPPSPAQIRLALGIVFGMACALFLVVGPFGGIQLRAVPSFVAVYTTAMFVTDSLTAVLLYAQFTILRSRAILVIASGYLFTAFLIVPYILAFPGVLATNGVVGGLETAAQLYLLWHCGFPLFVTAYALSKDEHPSRRLSQGKVSSEISKAVALTAASAAAVAFLCIQGIAPLPRLMVDRSRFVPEWPYLVAAPIAVLCTLAAPQVDSRSILDGRDVRILD
jgi:hypothetical protein